MNSGTWGFLILLPVFAVSAGGLGRALLSTSSSPLLRHISEWAEGLLTPFPTRQLQEQIPGPCPALPAFVGLSPNLVFVRCHWRLLAFPSPAAYAQCSMNHNHFTPLGRVIEIGWWTS